MDCKTRRINRGRIRRRVVRNKVNGQRHADGSGAAHRYEKACLSGYRFAEKLPGIDGQHGDQGQSQHRPQEETVGIRDALSPVR